jgi:preprotein translocase subunit SecG
MNAFYNIIVVVQVISALIIIGLVLLQHGKGADMGAAFGSGASGSLFGATGSSNFMSKSTGVAAAIFFASTLALAYFGSQHAAGTTGGVLDRAVAPVAVKPVTPPATGSGAIPGTSAAPATSTAPAATAPAPATPVNQIPK